MENMLSRAGGYVDGNIAYAGDLEPIRSSTQYTGYVYVPLTSGGSSTSWDGDAKTTGDNGIIDLSAVFGIPANVKAVNLRVAFNDETVNVSVKMHHPDNAERGLVQYTQVASQVIGISGVVACDSNGDISFTCSSEIDNMYVLILGYFL